MPEAQFATVTAAEAGQKLLQYLQRKLGKDVPKSALMKWMRKGHVRVNKGRVKPFDRVAEGDIVRIPPYQSVDNDPSEQSTTPADNEISLGSAADCRNARLSVLGRTEHVLVLHKPAGLPVQPGTGHADSIATRLRFAFKNADFCPSPAHRLDKNTSGVLLAGLTYAGLRALQAGFSDGHAIRKEYLAWVRGKWPHADAFTLEDTLVKDVQDASAGEKVRSVTSLESIEGKQAVCVVRPVKVGEESLLHITLHTGRTHQIRVQLAERGYPLIGDPKYGGPKCAEGLLLHAWRLTLPAATEAGSEADVANTGASYFVLPDWGGRFAITESLLSSF